MPISLPTFGISFCFYNTKFGNEHSLTDILVAGPAGFKLSVVSSIKIKKPLKGIKWFFYLKNFFSEVNHNKSKSRRFLSKRIITGTIKIGKRSCSRPFAGCTCGCGAVGRLYAGTCSQRFVQHDSAGRIFKN